MTWLLQAAQLGGWGFAAVMAAGIAWAIKDGVLVPGRLLDRALDQEEKALPAIEANTNALRELQEGVRHMEDTVRALERRVDDLMRPSRWA